MVGSSITADLLLSKKNPKDAKTSAFKAVANQNIPVGLDIRMTLQSPYAALPWAQLAEL